MKNFLEWKMRMKRYREYLRYSLKFKVYNAARRKKGEN